MAHDVEGPDAPVGEFNGVLVEADDGALVGSAVEINGTDGSVED